MKHIIFDFVEILGVATVVLLAWSINPIAGFGIACLWIGFISGVAAVHWASDSDKRKGTKS